MKLNRHNTAATQLRAMLPSNLQLAMDLCQEKGASSWLTGLPIEEYGFTLHKTAFRDASALRYGWLPANAPTSCACGAAFSAEHALSCPKGGFPSIRHNEIRDYTAYLLSEICHYASTEPHLQPITGEVPTSATANFQDGARLDVAADGFWGSRFERAFFDVKVFNPYAPSNRRPQPSACYRTHEASKKRAYERRILEVEHASFTPLIFSATGGLGREATVVYKRIAAQQCELFGCGDLSSFPPEMKVSRVPNLVILGAPIGDLIFCAKFVAQKRADAAVLLSQLAEVGAEDPQVAFLLLRQCAAFCKLVHLARSAPPSHIAEGLALFDKDVRQCFAECTAVDAADVEWMQAQLSLSRGGLGLRSLSSHCVAAYLASISSSGCDKWNLLVEPIELFNGLVPAEDAITLETLATSNMRQHSLSGKIEDQQFRQLFHISSPANRARLLSISSRHAASWLTVVPSPGLNLHLEPNEFQIAVKWWLGMDVSFGSCCPHCPDHRLDPLGHHALTCKHGGDVVLRHNSLRDVFVEFCHRACLGGQVEVGSGQGHDRLNSRPADVLVKNWHLGKPAAFDLTITSPLNPTTLTEAGVKCGSSAQVAEVRKHAANDGKCKELGWVCIPLAVESYGCWGMEAQESFKRLAARLAIQMGCSRSQATTTLYQRLSLSLVRANARALLSRARVHLEEGG